MHQPPLRPLAPNQCARPRRNGARWRCFSEIVSGPRPEASAYDDNVYHSEDLAGSPAEGAMGGSVQRLATV